MADTDAVRKAGTDTGAGGGLDQPALSWHHHPTLRPGSASGDALNLVLWAWEGRMTLVVGDNRLGLCNLRTLPGPRQSLQRPDRDKATDFQ